MECCARCGAPLPEQGGCLACPDRPEGADFDPGFEPLGWSADDEPIEGELIDDDPSARAHKLSLAAMTGAYHHLDISSLEAPTPPPILLPEDHPLLREEKPRPSNGSKDPLDDEDTGELVELAVEVSRWTTRSRYQGTLRSRLVKEPPRRARWIVPLALGLAGLTLVAAALIIGWR